MILSNISKTVSKVSFQCKLIRSTHFMPNSQLFYHLFNLSTSKDLQIGSKQFKMSEKNLQHLLNEKNQQITSKEVQSIINKLNFNQSDNEKIIEQFQINKFEHLVVILNFIGQVYLKLKREAVSKQVYLDLLKKYYSYFEVQENELLSQKINETYFLQSFSSLHHFQVLQFIKNKQLSLLCSVMTSKIQMTFKFFKTLIPTLIFDINDYSLLYEYFHTHLYPTLPYSSNLSQFEECVAYLLHFNAVPTFYINNIRQIIISKLQQNSIDYEQMIQIGNILHLILQKIRIFQTEYQKNKEELSYVWNIILKNKQIQFQQKSIKFEDIFQDSTIFRRILDHFLKTSMQSIPKNTHQMINGTNLLQNELFQIKNKLESNQIKLKNQLISIFFTKMLRLLGILVRTNVLEAIYFSKFMETEGFKQFLQENICFNDNLRTLLELKNYVLKRSPNNIFLQDSESNMLIRRSQDEFNNILNKIEQISEKQIQNSNSNIKLKLITQKNHEQVLLSIDGGAKLIQNLIQNQSDYHLSDQNILLCLKNDNLFLLSLNSKRVRNQLKKAGNQLPIWEYPYFYDANIQKGKNTKTNYYHDLLQGKLSKNEKNLIQTSLRKYIDKNMKQNE